MYSRTRTLITFTVPSIFAGLLLSGCGLILYPFPQETEFQLERAPYSRSTQTRRFAEEDLPNAATSNAAPLQNGGLPSGVTQAQPQNSPQNLRIDPRTHQPYDPTEGYWHEPGTFKPSNANARELPLVAGPERHLEEVTDVRGDRTDKVVLHGTCKQATIGNGPSMQECTSSLARLEANERIVEMCTASAEYMNTPGCRQYMLNLKPPDHPDRFRGGRSGRGDYYGGYTRWSSPEVWNAGYDY